jgi:hypothetical protein
LGALSVKLDRIGQNAALVDETIEQAVASLVPAHKGRSNRFQAVPGTKLFLDARHGGRKFRVPLAVGSVSQRRPIITSGDNSDRGAGHGRSCKLLVKEPDQLVGGNWLLRHDGLGLSASLRNQA